jgi:RNA polymerase sigma factor for flagellar operon FliA
MTELQRNDLVVKYYNLVKVTAISMHKALPVHVDLDDLIQAGELGLIDAADKFDESLNIPFSSYAKYRIKGAISDSLRQLDWSSRDMRRRRNNVASVINELNGELNRSPTQDEIATKLGVTLERWYEMQLDLATTGLVSSDTRADLDSDLPIPTPQDFTVDIEKEVISREQSVQLKKYVNRLPPRYMAVVMFYFYSDITLLTISEMLGIRESRVSQILKAALSQLRDMLEEECLI